MGDKCWVCYKCGLWTDKNVNDGERQYCMDCGAEMEQGIINHHTHQLLYNKKTAYNYLKPYTIVGVILIVLGIGSIPHFNKVNEMLLSLSIFIIGLLILIIGNKISKFKEIKFKYSPRQ